MSLAAFTRFTSPVNHSHQRRTASRKRLVPIHPFPFAILKCPTVHNKHGRSSLLSHQPFLVIVRALMEDEGDGGVPRGLQHPVPQPLLVGAVVPLGQVAGAVRVFGGRPHLPPVDAPPTPEPGDTMARRV